MTRVATIGPAAKNQSADRRIAIDLSRPAAVCVWRTDRSWLPRESTREVLPLQRAREVRERSRVMSGWASSPPQVRIPSPTAFPSLPRRSPVPPSSRCFRLAASRFIPPPPLPSSRSRRRPRSHPDPSRSRASQGYGGGVPPGSPPNHGGFGVPDGQSIPAYEPNAMPSHSGQMNHRGGGGAPPASRRFRRRRRVRLHGRRRRRFSQHPPEPQIPRARRPRRVRRQVPRFRVEQLRQVRLLQSDAPIL